MYILCEAVDSGEGPILPTWTAVDSGNVKTSRELWEYMKAQGWNVDVSTGISIDSCRFSFESKKCYSIIGMLRWDHLGWNDVSSSPQYSYIARQAY